MGLIVTTVLLKVAPIGSEDEPAIKMDPEDHQKTSSYGNSDSAKNYRAKQKKLIDEGKFLDAVQMDVDDIKNVEEKTGQIRKYYNEIK